MEDELKSLVGDLLSDLSALPAASSEDRRELRELSDELFAVTERGPMDKTALEIRQLSSKVCTGTDTMAQKLLEQGEAQLHEIVDALGSSLRDLGAKSQRFGGRLDGRIGELEDALRAGPSELAAPRLRDIAGQIRDAAGQIREELEATQSDVTSVNSRLQQMEQELQAAKSEAMKDPLTKLSNRRRLNDALATLGEATDRQLPWSLVMLDIDHFKKINDTHGHVIGDAVLIKLAALLNDVVPSPQLVARYGGEEFAVLLNGLDLAKACELAEQLRTRVVSTQWAYGEASAPTTISVTISLGVAQLAGQDTPESLVNRADAALYEAKRSGRNRVCQTT